MRCFLSILIILSLSGPAMASKFEFAGCSKASRQKIIAGVNWLVAHLADIDQQLGQGGLANWSGGSQDRFAKRLVKKTLRFSCHDPCEAPRFKQQQVGAWSLPIGHGAQIPICSAALSLPEQTAAVIAHGLGHLVWINAHRKSCHDRCMKPRLGTSLVQAVHNIATGTPYDAAQCLARCGPIPGQPTLATPDPAEPETPATEPPPAATP